MFGRKAELQEGACEVGRAAGLLDTQGRHSVKAAETDPKALAVSGKAGAGGEDPGPGWGCGWVADSGGFHLKT